MPPVFFLSYAHKDAEEEYFQRFVGDLRKEVMDAAGLGPEAKPFTDREIKPGEPWNPAIGRAVGTSAVFVPVVSPYYFQSEMCGREWSAFAARKPSGGPQGPAARRNIIPVMWRIPFVEPPADVTGLQDTRNRFGPTYRDEGLRSLMTVKRNRDLYQDFVKGFARLVLDAATRPPESLDVPDLEALPNAFAAPATATTRPRVSRQAGGPQHVTFIVAAENRQTMDGYRDCVDVYGADAREWKPYHPVCPSPVATRAQVVAGGLNLFSTVATADGSLFQTLEDAERDRGLVVLLVDPWTTKVPGYDVLYRQLNRIRSGNAGIVIPQEASAQRGPDQSADEDGASDLAGPDADPSVRDLLARCLDLWLHDGTQVVLRDVASIEEFESSLGNLLASIRALIVNRAEVSWQTVTEGPRYRPVLSGPGS